MFDRASNRSSMPCRPRIVGRHRVGDPAVAAASERLVDPAGDLPGVDLRLLALRIDRHDASRAVTDQVDDRVRHLQPAAIDVGLAEQRDLRALAELTFTPRLVEEHHLHAAGPVADVDVHHRATVAGHALGHRPDGGQHQGLLTRHQIGDARLVRPIDPATGVEGDEVEQVVDADGGERCALLVADALEPTDVDLGEVAERQCVHPTPDLTRPRRGTGTAVGRRGARPRGCCRDDRSSHPTICSVTPSSASAPVTTVTSSAESPTIVVEQCHRSGLDRGRRPQRCRRRERSRSSRPRTIAPMPLVLSRTARVISPVVTESAASVISAALSAAEASGS